MERTFTYRNGCLFFGASIFGIGGGLFFLRALIGALTGHPIPFSQNGHVLPPDPLITWCVVFVLSTPVILSIWLWLFAMNTKVVVDDAGVRFYDSSKRLKFQAKWTEITNVYRSYQNSSSYSIAVQTDKHCEMITNSVLNMNELEQILIEKSGKGSEPRTSVGLPLMNDEGRLESP